MTERKLTEEERRLEASENRKEHWKRWGPYLSERAWGTVREDYSAEGIAWNYFPHDHARSRSYRWNEDGIAGISDRHQKICFALSLWNGHDTILKERIFGLSGTEGNHGEDVKEYYYYLDSTPTHSYMEFLYKYSQREFPYVRLVEENKKRGRKDLEFELIDTGIFDDDRYFDVFVDYAKADPETIFIRIRAINRGAEDADLHLLPTIWFRNTWNTGLDERRPGLRKLNPISNCEVIRLNSYTYGYRWLYCEDSPEVLFTENETNTLRLFGAENGSNYFKDGINDYVIHSKHDAVNPKQKGTKAAAWYKLRIAAGKQSELRLAFTNQETENPFSEFEKTIQLRKLEADQFYETVIPNKLSEDKKNVLRQSLAGMLWSKQFYHYDVNRWLKGDPAQPRPPQERKRGRNSQWNHLYNADVISMPDKWEYPWYAAWDLAFHCIPLAIMDPDFAKEQLVLLLREWYMHPNGQLPAYEWKLGDVNPPVHAWAAWRVYKIEKKRKGTGDRKFLERVFHKLLLNFTWWINRKDTEGRNVFQGGFLGLDNIGVFDRSAPLPTGGFIEQSDGTSWMGMYCLNMLSIALELAREDSAYEDVASKFFEHFVFICNAMNNIAGGIELWNEEDGFYYDVLHLPGGGDFPMKIRSMVGLIPLFAVQTLDPDEIDHLPGFKRRMHWFIENRPDLGDYIETQTGEKGFRRFLSLVNPHRLRRVLNYMLDEAEFLSPYGIRALSRIHKDRPYILHVDGNEYRVDYEPAESATPLFGGNSNWRGPIWFPLNYLIIESLQKFHFYLGDSYKVEFPKGSGKYHDLSEIARDLSHRLTNIFLLDENQRRPVFGEAKKFQEDPHWRDYILFYEYFHGDNGAGIGASHQTGWTGLVAKLLQQSGEY